MTKKKSLYLVNAISTALSIVALAIASNFTYYFIQEKPHRDLFNKFRNTLTAKEYNGVLSDFAANEGFQIYFSGDRVFFYETFRVQGESGYQRTWVDDEIQDPWVEYIRKNFQKDRLRTYRALNERGVKLEQILSQQKKKFKNKTYPR